MPASPVPSPSVGFAGGLTGPGSGGLVVKGHWEIAVAEGLAALVFLCCWMVRVSQAWASAAGNVRETWLIEAAWLVYIR